MNARVRKLTKEVAEIREQIKMLEAKLKSVETQLVIARQDDRIARRREGKY